MTKEAPRPSNQEHDPYIQSVLDEDDLIDAPPFVYEGTSLQVREAYPRLVAWKDNDHIVYEPTPKPVSAVYYFPMGNIDADPKATSLALLSGLNELSDYAKKVENGEIERPFALRSFTPRNVALLARRVGFNEVDNLRLTDGIYTIIVARYEDMVKKIEELREQPFAGGTYTLEEMLQRRVDTEDR